MWKSFSQLHVKNSRFFLSYFLKKDDWPSRQRGCLGPQFSTHFRIMKTQVMKDCSIHYKWKFSFANFNREKCSTKNLLLSLENEDIFFKGNRIVSIKLEQRLSKSISQLRVKNSRFFLSYFLKKDNWPKVYAGPRLPILSYKHFLNFITLNKNSGKSLNFMAS